MEVAYFPGCSLHSMALEYDVSTRLVSERLGLSLREVRDWNCCGASAAHSLDHLLAVSLSARNLALVNEMNLSDVTSPCAGCFNRLKTARHELVGDDHLRDKVLKLVEAPISFETRVTHFLQFLVEEVGLEAITREVVKPLGGMKLAAYYGCLLTRPALVTEFDDPEQPKAMDRMLQALGAQTVDWSHKAECCGGGFAASQTDIVCDLGGEVLKAARQAGAEALVAACPLCQVNLDTRQRDIEARQGSRYNLPVIFFTQLIGLAFGFSPKALGLKRLLTDPFPLLKSRGLA